MPSKQCEEGPCQCRSVHIPIGAETEFKGMIDLAHDESPCFHDETLGAEWDEAEIPEDL